VKIAGEAIDWAWKACTGRKPSAPAREREIQADFPNPEEIIKIIL
jgi:hypothetical protein